MNDMENFENLSSDEMEKMLHWVTNDQITWNVSITEVAKKPWNSDSWWEEGGEDDGDKTPEPSKGGDNNPPSNTDAPQKKSWFAKVLAERNSLRERIKELEQEKAGVKSDEEMDPYDRDEKLIESTAKQAYASEKLSDMDRQMEETFYEEYPKAEEHKEQINVVLQEHPELTLEDARKLYASRTNPLLLLDDQQINKMKGWDLDFIWSQSPRSTSSVKDPENMSTNELESYLKDAVSQWVVV